MVRVTEDTGTTYAIQYFCPSLEEFHKYEQTQAPRLRQVAIDKFQNQFVAFRTLLEVVE